MNGNMKKIWVFFLLLGLVLITGSCRPPDNPVKPEQMEEKQGALPDYEIITDTERLPAEVKSMADFLKSERGYFVFTPSKYATGEDSYLFISSGEKPTGGYALAVDSAAVAGDTLKIVVQEEEPAAEQGVIQVLTYPHLLLKINSSYQNFQVVNDKNESLAAIPAETVPEINAKEGVYNGQIDSNFIEMEVDGQAQAFMLGPEKDYLLEALQSGDEVFISYYKNEYGQLIIIDLR